MSSDQPREIESLMRLAADGRITLFCLLQALIQLRANRDPRPPGGDRSGAGRPSGRSRAVMDEWSS